MGWNEMPDYDEVKQALHKKAELKAQVRIAELKLQMLQATISQQKPRDTAARIIGIDEKTRTGLATLQSELTDLRNLLDEVEGEIEFLNYHKEIYKAIAYKERF